MTLVAGRNPASRWWPSAPANSETPSLSDERACIIIIEPEFKRLGPHHKRIPIPPKPPHPKRKITR